METSGLRHWGNGQAEAGMVPDAGVSIFLEASASHIRADAPS